MIMAPAMIAAAVSLIVSGQTAAAAVATPVVAAGEANAGHNSQLIRVGHRGWGHGPGWGRGRGWRAGIGPGWGGGPGWRAGAGSGWGGGPGWRTGAGSGWGGGPGWRTGAGSGWGGGPAWGWGGRILAGVRRRNGKLLAGAQAQAGGVDGVAGAPDGRLPAGVRDGRLRAGAGVVRPGEHVPEKRDKREDLERIRRSKIAQCAQPASFATSPFLLDARATRGLA